MIRGGVHGKVPDWIWHTRRLEIDEAVRIQELAGDEIGEDRDAVVFGLGDVVSDGPQIGDCDRILGETCNWRR